MLQRTAPVRVGADAGGAPSAVPTRFRPGPLHGRVRGAPSWEPQLPLQPVVEHVTRHRHPQVAAGAASRQAQTQRAPRRAATEEEEQEEEDQEEGAVRGAAAEAPAEAAPEAALPAQTEAVAVVQAALITEELEEEVEQVIEPLTFQSALVRSRSWLTSTWPGKLVVGAAGAVLVGTLAVAVARVWAQANTARAQRLRQIDRNRQLIDGINRHLLAPGASRASLTPGVLRSLQRSSGYSGGEVFRKYLWYALRERRFDAGCVEDLVAIKEGLGLSDADTGEALRERAARMYDKYGTLMLNTEGLTLAGAQRKATCTALFRKVLYLAECARLVGAAAAEPGGSGHVADIGKIFGATLEDMDRLRIKNLYEAELDLEGMVAADSADDDEQQGEGPGAAAAGRAPPSGSA